MALGAMPSCDVRRRQAGRLDLAERFVDWAWLEQQKQQGTQYTVGLGFN